MEAMKKQTQKFEECSKISSSNILDSIWLLEALEELAQGDPKLCTIISVIKTKLKTAFDKIESTRQIISEIN